MKKFVSYLLIVLLVLSALACASKTASSGPENPNFTVVVDDAATAEALQYFQAHTGYLPAIVTADETTAQSEDALKQLADGATCLLLKDEALIAAYTALGYAVDNEALKNLTASYRIDNADILGVTVVQMPAGSELNADALKALVSWMTGAEAKYLADNPALLNK